VIIITWKESFFIVSDTTEKHFAKLHTSDIKVQKHTAILNLIVCDKIPCVPLYTWTGQLSLENVTCSICGISVEMCVICENFMHLFPLVVIKYEKDKTFMASLAAKHQLPKN
jgi:hypothetical protein